MPLIFVENDAHIMETHPTGFKRRHCFVAEPETVRTIPCRCEEDQHQLFMNLLSPILQVRDEFTSIELNEVGRRWRRTPLDIVVVDRRRRRQLGHRHHLREHHLRQSLDPKDIFLEDTKTFWTQNQRKILRYKNVLEENYFGNFNDVTKISTSRSVWKRSGHISNFYHRESWQILHDSAKVYGICQWNTGVDGSTSQGWNQSRRNCALCGMLGLNRTSLEIYAYVCC